MKQFVLFFWCFVAGLLMNFMPCSLPMLGIRLKAMLSCKSDVDSFKRMLIGTSVGIVGSLVLINIGGLMMSFIGKSTDSSFVFAGLQSPFVVAVLCVVCFILLQIRLGVLVVSYRPSNRQLYGGFFSGLVDGFVMTFFNTACLAPVFASILILSSSSIMTSLLSSVAMGFGLAFFYILLLFKPQFSLAFNNSKLGTILDSFVEPFMALTVLWLVSILVNQIGMFFGVAALFILLIGAFILKKAISFTFKIFVIVAVLGCILYVVNLSHYAIFEAKDNNLWSEISQDEIDDSLLQNKVVLVMVTADWCFTCKLNKYTTWNSKRFFDFVQNNDVVIMKGDLTLKNDAVSGFVKKWDNILPLTILYSVKNPSGRILNSITTPFYITDEIEKELTLCTKREDIINMNIKPDSKPKIKKASSGNRLHRS